MSCDKPVIVVVTYEAPIGSIIQRHLRSEYEVIVVDAMSKVREKIEGVLGVGKELKILITDWSFATKAEIKEMCEMARGKGVNVIVMNGGKASSEDLAEVGADSFPKEDLNKGVLLEVIERNLK